MPRLWPSGVLQTLQMSCSGDRAGSKWLAGTFSKISSHGHRMRFSWIHNGCDDERPTVPRIIVDWTERGNEEFLQEGGVDKEKKEFYSLRPYFLILRYRVAWPSPSLREASPMFP